MTIVTEVTDVEEVTSDRGQFQYVEYLLATFDRDARNPSDARVVGTERVRIRRTLEGNISVEHLDGLTLQRTDVKTSPAGMDLAATVELARMDSETRITDKEAKRKWRAERFSN